jgi:hypothetical protein
MNSTPAGVGHDPYAAAKAAAMEDAEAWLPWQDSPEVVVGAYVRDDEGPDRGYGPPPIKVLRERDGKEWAVWLTKSVLLREWEDTDPQRGDVVAVRYGGKRTTRDGTEYHHFRVAAESPRERGTEEQEVTEPELPPPEQEQLVVEGARSSPADGDDIPF